MKISPARIASFDILRSVEGGGAFSSILLANNADTLSPPDRGLCYEIVLGTLRRQIFLDRVIDQLSGGKKLDIEVRIALRIGLFQLFHLDRVPAYSAINESVELVQRARLRSAKGLTNAILRRSVREKIEVRPFDEVDAIVLETSHPRWLIEKWGSFFGKAEAYRICRKNNQIAPAAFRILGGAGEKARKFAAGCRRSPNVEGCYIAEPADRNLTAFARAGEIYVQDEASQLTARSVAIDEGGYFLDVCASPGGKTGLISDIFGGSAGLIAAGDLSEARVRILAENLRGQGADGVSVVRYDASTRLPFSEAAFDSILVDAPCSGTGTIRRNPEIRYRVGQESIDALARKQLEILQNASKLLRPGGRLTYSTCSLEPEENEGVCDKFLSGDEGFRKVSAGVPARFATDEGFARTLPTRDDMDGFFIAAFVRHER